MYQYISSASHGWLKVPLEEIDGIKEIESSRFSFYDGTFAYLEEDCDMPTFIKARGISVEDINESYRASFQPRSLPRLVNRTSA